MKAFRCAWPGERQPLRIFLALTAMWVCLVLSASATTYKSGTISTDETWDLAGSPYVLNGDVTVASGAQLSIEADVEVQTGNSDYEIFVDGDLQASAVGFTGAHTEIRARDAGVRTLADGTIVEGSVYFEASSAGSITSSTIGGALTIAAGATPTIDDNTLTGTNPVYCRVECFPLLLDNTFSSTPGDVSKRFYRVEVG